MFKKILIGLVLVALLAGGITTPLLVTAADPEPDFHQNLMSQGVGAKGWINTFTEIEYLGNGIFATSITTGHRVFFDKADNNKPKKHKLTDERSSKGYVLIQSAKVAVEIYPSYAKYFDVQHEEVRVKKEQWVVQWLFKEPDIWKNVKVLDSFISIEEYSEPAGDVVSVTVTFDTDYGTLTVEYFQRDGNTLKHNVTFQNTSGSTETFRVIQKWTGIAGNKVKHQTAAGDVLTSTITSAEVINSPNFRFLKDDGSLSVFENQSAMYFNNQGEGLLDQNIKPVEIDVHPQGMKADFVFGNWVLTQDESLEIDPDTATLDDPTVDGHILDAGYIRNTTSVVVWLRVTSIYRGYIEWDVSSILDGATITNTVFKYRGNTNETDGQIRAMANQPSAQPDNAAGNQIIYDDIGDGTIYYDTAGFPVVGTNQEVDLGSSADSDLQSALAGGWFAIGLQLKNEVSQDNTSAIHSEESGGADPKPTLYVEYTIPAAPVVTTQAATSVEGTTATGNGNITDTGAESVDYRGIAWDTTSRGDPGTLSPAARAYSHYNTEGPGSYGMGAFTSSMTSLPVNTTIYARAYAHSSVDWSWGSEVSFTTHGPPSVTTSAASSVEETTATLDGEITALNNGNATTRGFEWGIDSGSPYANDWFGTGSFGTGAFDHDITGLTKGELYYYRVYAINVYGTGNGSEVLFLTKPDGPNTLDTVVGGATQLDLTWVKGTGAQKTYIRGQDGSYPTDRSDGYLVYNDTGTSTSDLGLTGGHTYYYRAWSYATEGGKEQYSDLYDQDSAILTLGLELWYQPETIISGTTLVDRQGSYDGAITWGGRFADSGTTITLVDSELTQADDYWNGRVLKVVETTDGNAPEGEESEITDFTAATLGGTADSGSTITLVDSERTQPDDFWNGTTLAIVTTTDGGAPQGESEVVSDWVLSSNTLTTPAFTAAIEAGDTYTLTSADTLWFGALTVAPESGDRYEIWDGQTILWASFPEGISVEIGPITAYTDPVSSAAGLEAPTVAGLPQEPGGLWGGSASVDLPLYPLFSRVAVDLGWTPDVLYVTASFIVAIGMGLALLITTGSVLGAVAGVGVGMTGGIAIGVLPVWILVVYLILAGTWLYTSRSM